MPTDDFAICSDPAAHEVGGHWLIEDDAAALATLATLAPDPAGLRKADHITYCVTCGKTRFVEWLHRECEPEGDRLPWLRQWITNRAEHDRDRDRALEALAALLDSAKPRVDAEGEPWPIVERKDAA